MLNLLEFLDVLNLLEFRDVLNLLHFRYPLDLHGRKNRNSGRRISDEFWSRFLVRWGKRWRWPSATWFGVNLFRLGQPVPEGRCPVQVQIASLKRRKEMLHQAANWRFAPLDIHRPKFIDCCSSHLSTSSILRSICNEGLASLLSERAIFTLNRLLLSW